MTTESKPRPLKDQTNQELREELHRLKVLNRVFNRRLAHAKASVLHVPGCYHTVNGEQCNGTVTFEAGSEVGVCQECGRPINMVYEG